jgi:hypothetical protein
MLPVIWHYNSGFWDCALPRYILDGAASCQHFEYNVVNEPGPQLANPPVGVIVIPGRHSCGDYAALNAAAAQFEKVVFIIIGDEEGIFHADQLQHKKKTVVWFMPPFHPLQKVDWVGPNGWPTGAPEMISTALGFTKGVRDLNWSFLGQMTHIRRIMCVSACQELEAPGYLLPTNGFTLGQPRNVYYDVMVRSKLVLCPSGPCTPDSFRFAEALEAGCIPIVDDLIQHAWYPPGYFQYVLGENLPFPVLNDWNTLPQVVEEWLDDWELKADRCQRWWKGMKIGWTQRMQRDLDV